jgi:hypothetical protein
MRTSKRTRWSLALAAALASLGLTSQARAETEGGATVLAFDLDYAVPPNSNTSDGLGFGVRLGRQVRLPPLLSVTPELAFTYHGFDPDGPAAYRGLVGMRLGFGEIVRPGAFAHLGIGRVNTEAPAPSSTGLGYDAGVFLDFTLLPLFNIGAHAAYNGINASDVDPNFNWVTVGAHAALVF